MSVNICRCVPAEESQSHENGAIPSANLPNAVTVTISITVPSPAENHTDRFAPEDVGRWLLEAFEEALSKSAATNFTVVGASKQKFISALKQQLHLRNYRTWLSL